MLGSALWYLVMAFPLCYNMAGSMGLGREGREKEGEEWEEVVEEEKEEKKEEEGRTPY